MWRVVTFRDYYRPTSDQYALDVVLENLQHIVTEALRQRRAFPKCEHLFRSRATCAYARDK